MINLIASDVLNVDLSHISGKAIVEGDKISIRNFLEIFAGLLEYFMEYVNDEGTCHFTTAQASSFYIHTCIVYK